MLRIGLTGGMGSGKSTVARVFAALGAPVYDSDLRSRALLDGDAGVVAAVTGLLGKDAYTGGRADRAYIASRVFGAGALLRGLEAVMHPAVTRDFLAWAAERDKEGARYVVLESAILLESGFDTLVDYTVAVSAPRDERIARVVRRDGTDAGHVALRMDNQMDDAGRESRADFVVRNGAGDMVVPRVVELDKMFGDESR